MNRDIAAVRQAFAQEMNGVLNNATKIRKLLNEILSVFAANSFKQKRQPIKNTSSKLANRKKWL